MSLSSDQPGAMEMVSRRARCIRPPPRRSSETITAPRPAPAPTCRARRRRTVRRDIRHSSGSVRRDRGREHRHDRLEVAAAEDLDPSCLDQRPDAARYTPASFGQPFHAAAPRYAARTGHVGVILHDPKERLDSCLVGRFEDPVEVADRLMVVQGEDEADAVHGEWCPESGLRGDDP